MGVIRLHTKIAAYILNWPSGPIKVKMGQASPLLPNICSDMLAYKNYCTLTFKLLADPLNLPGAAQQTLLSFIC